MITKELEHKVLDWAKKKGILDNGTTDKQAEKTVEEANETLDAVRRGSRKDIKDGIGDTIVTLIILAEMHGWNIGDCVNAAYHEIKNRTGKMIDGQFVKEQ